MNPYVSVAVYVSLPTLDLDVWRTTEPGTAPPASRLRAIRMLADAGIDVGVGMAPILPGLSDRPEQLEASSGPHVKPAQAGRVVWSTCDLACASTS